MMEHIYQQASFGENWFGYEQLYRHFVQTVPTDSVIVEVGSWKGKSVAYLGVEVINSGKNIQIVAVDTWQGSGVIHSTDWYVQNDKLYELFTENTRPISSVLTSLRMPSVEAAKTFVDGSIAAVFIDANHEYEPVRDDIAAWYPKVRKGGIIAGHDYDGRPETGHPGVRRAVHEAFGQENLIVYPANCWVYNKPN